MNVTKTLLNVGNNTNYMASQQVAGLPDPVVAIAPTRITAIAACNLKVELAVKKVAQYRRRPITRKLSVLCACR